MGSKHHQAVTEHEIGSRWARRSRETHRMIDCVMPERPSGRSHELRAAKRIGTVLELQYRNEGHLLLGYCTNLSRGGLFVPTRVPLPLGTQLTLSIRLPDEEVVQVDAEVRWTRDSSAPEGAGMGLAFCALDTLLGTRIDTIVQSFGPMRIIIVSNNSSAREHVAAVLRASLTCETELRTVDRALAHQLDDADLVIIDLDRARGEGTALLEGLASRADPPPWLLLSEEVTSPGLRRARALGRLVQTPVDSEELRAAAIEAIAHVRALVRPTLAAVAT